MLRTFTRQVVEDDTRSGRSMPSLTTCDRTTFDRWQTGRMPSVIGMKSNGTTVRAAELLTPITIEHASSTALPT